MRRILSALLVLAAVAGAKDIYGTWFANDYSWTLELAEKGEYVSQSQMGESVGRYFIDGDLLTFQDAYTGAVATYTFQFEGDVLQLADQMGVSYLFVRKGSPAQQLPPGTVIEDPSYVSPLLSDKEGFSLREEDTRTCYELAEILLGEPIGEEDDEEILEGWIAAFEADPAGFTQRLGEISQMRDKFYSTTDPLEVAKLRSRFLAQGYREEDDWFIDVILSRLEILVSAEDAVLSGRDLQAFTDYAGFLAALGGGTGGKDSLSILIVEEFATFLPSKRQIMASGQVVYDYFSYVWDRADSGERKRIAEDILAEQAVEGVDYSVLEPSSQLETGEGSMIWAVFRLDQEKLIRVWSAGESLPYYYELY